MREIQKGGDWEDNESDSATNQGQKLSHQENLPLKQSKAEDESTASLDAHPKSANLESGRRKPVGFY